MGRWPVARWPDLFGTGCPGGENNPYGFANDEVALADECDATVDADERAACYNELDKFVTTLEKDPVQGLFMLPLTQKPSFYGYTGALVQAVSLPTPRVRVR